MRHTNQINYLQVFPMYTFHFECSKYIIFIRFQILQYVLTILIQWIFTQILKIINWTWFYVAFSFETIGRYDFMIYFVQFTQWTFCSTIRNGKWFQRFFIFARSFFVEKFNMKFSIEFMQFEQQAGYIGWNKRWLYFIQ